MRSMIVAAFFAVGLLATPVFAQEGKGVEKEDAKQEKEQKEAAKLNVYEATVEGMTWGVAWVGAVKKTASSLDGVKTAEVDFKAERLTVTMKEGESLNEKSLFGAFEETRFTLKDFKQTQGGEEEASEGATYKATISGMTWGVTWVKAVKKTVTRLDGVDQVEIDFSNKIATITMKDGKTLDEAALKKAFEDTRFDVTKFEAEEKKDEAKKDKEVEETN